MKVRASRISTRPWLTPGKEYEATPRVHLGTEGYNVVDDDGENIFIQLKDSAHLGFNDWEIVGDIKR